MPPPSVYPDAPLQLLVTNIDYDEHKGRICIARINAGTLRASQQVAICRSDTEVCRRGALHLASSCRCVGGQVAALRLPHLCVRVCVCIAVSVRTFS